MAPYRVAAVLSALLFAAGCASDAPCFCSLLTGDVAQAGPPPEPDVAWAPAPPVAAPPPPAPSRRIVLRGVNFNFDSAQIRPEDQAILDAAVDALKENPGVKVEVAGHTDSTGPESYNQGLSVRRANSVTRYLVEQGVKPERLDPEGYGEDKPVADNASRDGRAQNRRVELNIQQ